MLATRAEIQDIIFQNINQVISLSRSKAYNFVEARLSKTINHKKFDAIVDRVITRLEKKI